MKKPAFVEFQAECRNFWSLTAESNPLPIAEQACFQILGVRSEGRCLTATGMSEK